MVIFLSRNTETEEIECLLFVEKFYYLTLTYTLKT